MNVSSASTDACPRCGAADRRTVPQTFRDGSEHARQECARCGGFLGYAKRRPERQPLPLPVAAPPVTPSRLTPTSTPAAATTLERAVGVLEHVRSLVVALLNELQAGRIDQSSAVAVLGCAVAAAANLAKANVSDLANAVRRGQLPRTKARQ